MLKTAIRADASIEIGTGHIMRCLALLEAFPKETNVSFLCYSLLPHLEKLIQKKGYAIEKLPNLLAPLSNTYDVLVIDHYKLNAEWEEEAKQKAKKTLVIEDTPNRPHHSDLLLDQNFSLNEQRYDHFLKTSAKTLLGPKYALLRNEIREKRKNLERSFGPLKSLFISMGGVDPGGTTLKVLRAIPSLDKYETVQVVTTSANPHLAELKKFALSHDNVQLHIDSPHYFSLMKDADLAIAAGGSSTWERLCLGLPTIQLVLFDNQLELTQQLHAEKYVMAIGLGKEKWEVELPATLKTLESPEERKAYAERGMKLVDGLGSERVFSALHQN